MIAFGLCIGSEQKYRRWAAPTIEEFAPGAPILERRGQKSIFLAYNSILAEARQLANIEALVLIHEDVELRQPVDHVLRTEFSDPTVAIAGVIGGLGVRSVRWSLAKRTFGHAPDGYNGTNDHGRGFFDVDIVDGHFLALSPWALHSLSFDTERYSGFHAYDADICMQARAAQKRVRVVDIDLFHHTKGGFGDVADHRISEKTFRAKWSIGRNPIIPLLRQRARGARQRAARRNAF